MQLSVGHPSNQMMNIYFSGEENALHRENNYMFRQQKALAGCYPFLQFLQLVNI
jgi:hypothetical protein